MRFFSLLIRNHPLANITFVCVLLVGLLAYLQMPREQDPEINFNWVNIVASLPGASAEDVEKRITNPLEDAIKSVPDVRYVQSSSRENISSILVRFREIDARLFDKRINDLRRELQNKRAELPVEAKDPLVLEITTSNGFPTAQVVLAGRADDETLRSLARALREEMERMPGIDRVYAVGLRDPELRVEFDSRATAARNLTGADVADSVSGWFRDTFAGRARTTAQVPGSDGAGSAAGNPAGGAATGREWLVRVLGERMDPAELAKVSVLSPRGATASLDAVARVSRERARASTLAGFQGRPAVVFSVTKKSYTNTLKLVERINGFIAEKNPLLAARGVELTLLDDQTIPTREAIRIMESNALYGLLVVFAICWLFLGSRIAVLVSLGIPFSLAGTFAVLHATGTTLNVSVLLGVVIALGMLVDDAVVIVETIYYRMERGENAFDAAVGAVNEVFAPVLSSVGTTLAAFLPLMLLPGILGKFMFVIPFVVSLALLISLVEAFWMLPAHISALPPAPPKPGRVQIWRTRFTRRLRSAYSRWLIKVFRHPKLSLGAMLLAFAAAAGALAGGAINVQFFAFDPLRVFYVNVDMPPGTPIETTLKRMDEVAARAQTYLKDGEARGIATYAGLKFTDTEPLYGDAYAQVVISLNARGDDGRTTPQVVEAMRSTIEKLPGPGVVSFTQLSGGPPAGKPIKVNVRADDFGELRAAADALKKIAREKIPGARDVVDDDVPGRPELVLTLDRDALKNAGLSPALVARLVRLHVEGEIVVITRDKREKIELRVRARREAETDIAAILDDPIALPGGGSVPLRQLVQIETRTSRGIIKHYGLKRSVTVTGDLDKTLTDTGKANDILKAEWKKIQLQHPNADLDFSGELDDLDEALDAMKLLFLLGLGLIYMILAAQFRSYFQPMMILVTVPMAFTGVALGLLLSRNPMSLYTLYGVIALTGIAVNSAIVLIDAANERRARGMSVLHAAVYAARRRIVPILITSTTTIGGLASLAFGIGGESLLWQPVAGAIVWGLSIATVMTAFIVPLIYRLCMPEKGSGSGWWTVKA